MRPFQYISILFSVFLILIGYLSITNSISWIWLIASCLTYLTILYFCVTQIQWNYYIKSINHGVGNVKSVTLTFDDGPNTETAAILDILREKNVKACFFCIGTRVEKTPELVKRMHDEGHIVGNHSYSHSYSFDWKSPENMLNDIHKCNSSIKDVIGKEPLLFRPPYGITNPNLYRAVKKSKMYSIGWSLRSFDTTIKSKDRLMKKIITNLKGGDIVLLHDSQTITREILTELIDTAREKGFTFVPLNQLVDLDVYS